MPANEASWEDLQTVFGTRGAACQLPVPALQAAAAGGVPLVSRRGTRPPAARSRPTAAILSRTTTSGLVAYLDGEPVGWCAVEPRPAYEGLVRNTRVPWEGRDEDKADDSVWAVTCLFTRAGFRKRGVSRALARAAVDFARERGARAIEGYPMTTKNAIAEELHVGTEGVFAAAGFAEVSSSDAAARRDAHRLLTPGHTPPPRPVLPSPARAEALHGEDAVGVLPCRSSASRAPATASTTARPPRRLRRRARALPRNARVGPASRDQCSAVMSRTAASIPAPACSTGSR